MSNYSLNPPDRRKILDQIVSGDVFYAVIQNDCFRICIVSQIISGKILARAATTQEKMVFSVKTGETSGANGNAVARIISCEPLPIDLYNTLIGLDRRYRLSIDPYRARLTEAEKKHLVSIKEFYLSYRI